MCGIAGFVGLEDRKLVKKMCDIIAYRGPDDEGYHTDKNVSLGNRRLSIIDVAGGKQPIYNEDGSIVVVFNGEIYNYQSVKQQLERNGHNFKTNSDTETIVHAYEEYGEDCVKHFNGMFAFAIWDTNKKTLFAARDRLGEKPFYYTVTNNNFVFASEIKSILMFPGIKRRINTGALDKFLSLRYCPGNETMVCGVFKLKPGHWLKYSNGSIEIKKYWDLKPGDINQRDESYYSGLFARLLEDSVRMRLISEVPLGIYLSGGLDSSAITAVASRALEKPVNTFSMGFGTEKESEFDYARLVSEKFGTNHKEIMVNNRSFDALPEIIWHNDEPLGDPTIIPTYFISKATKKHATVVLTGEGADELFSGYFHEKAMILADRFLANKRISGDTYAKLAKLAPDFILNKFFEYPADLGDAGKERIYRSLRNLHSNAAMYATFVENFSEEEKRGILKTYKTTASMFKDYFGGGNEISQNMLLIDREMWLPDYILLRLDRMTMANSVEGRVPYLDHRLMELSMSMPQKLKLRGFTEKYILRRAMKNILPAEILKRKKRPFITPVSEWGEKSLKEMFSAVFGERRFASDKLINPSKVFGLPNKYEKSKLITGRQMFSLLSLELWVRIFINTDPSEWKIKNLSKVCGL